MAKNKEEPGDRLNQYTSKWEDVKLKSLDDQEVSFMDAVKSDDAATLIVLIRRFG